MHSKKRQFGGYGKIATSLSHDWLVITASELPALPQFVTFLTEIFADPEFAMTDVVGAIELESTSHDPFGV